VEAAVLVEQAVGGEDVEVRVVIKDLSLYAPPSGRSAITQVAAGKIHRLRDFRWSDCDQSTAP
jgi:hypothetical protein